MARRKYTTLPADYTVCQHGDCPMAANCLHQQAYTTLQESETFLQLINPRKCTKSDKCKYYRDSTPVRYARGFTGFQKKMFPEQYQTFMWTLIEKFGRNAYYERRNGTLILSPKEQETILAALREAGVTENLPFDRYEEQVNYCD
ncbi:MAG: hypothetical protein IKQ37_08855 [Bacteroidaceae bacterium]|nr:hypothetical protein [Bacteroidaceae bacterium]